jgi:hypothetical protein
MYYADPDGNRIEFLVDNFATAGGAKAYCALPEFANNSVGVEFDPADLLRRLEAGESESVLKKRPNIGPPKYRNVQGLRTDSSNYSLRSRQPFSQAPVPLAPSRPVGRRPSWPL